MKFQMSKIRALLAALSFGWITPAFADQEVAVACQKIPGMIAGPIVATPDVAKEIYLAVANGRDDPIDPANVIVVEDGSDHWSVLQYRKGSPLRGGGSLEMTIDKCNGAMSASYAR